MSAPFRWSSHSPGACLNGKPCGIRHCRRAIESRRSAKPCRQDRQGHPARGRCIRVQLVAHCGRGVYGWSSLNPGYGVSPAGPALYKSEEFQGDPAGRASIVKVYQSGDYGNGPSDIDSGTASPTGGFCVKSSPCPFRRLLPSSRQLMASDAAAHAAAYRSERHQLCVESPSARPDAVQAPMSPVRQRRRGDAGSDLRRSREWEKPPNCPYGRRPVGNGSPPDPVRIRMARARGELELVAGRRPFVVQRRHPVRTAAYCHVGPVGGCAAIQPSDAAWHPPVVRQRVEDGFVDGWIGGLRGFASSASNLERRPHSVGAVRCSSAKLAEPARRPRGESSIRHRARAPIHRMNRKPVVPSI